MALKDVQHLKAIDILQNYVQNQVVETRNLYRNEYTLNENLISESIETEIMTISDYDQYRKDTERLNNRKDLKNDVVYMNLIGSRAQVHVKYVLHLELINLVKHSFDWTQFVPLDHQIMTHEKRTDIKLLF